MLVNFLVFTLAMVILPLGSYFLSLNTLFNGTQPSPLPNMLSCIRRVLNGTPGNTTWSAATAAIVANLVLAAFVVQALGEDRSDKRAGKPEGKKHR